jgi:hypothetical protein
MVGYLEEYVIYSDEVTPAYESLACACVLQKKVMIEQNVPIVVPGVTPADQVERADFHSLDPRYRMNRYLARVAGQPILSIKGDLSGRSSLS